MHAFSASQIACLTEGMQHLATPSHWRMRIAVESSLLHHFGRLNLRNTALQLESRAFIRDTEDRCMHMRACGHATVYLLCMQAETEALLNGPLNLPAL